MHCRAAVAAAYRVKAAETNAPTSNANATAITARKNLAIEI
jgi:hypothetical protein